MKAMILAAGRGKRMGALTADRPKPLLRVGSDSLIGWQLRRLARAGYREVVINLGYRGEMIAAALGDGSAFTTRANRKKAWKPPAASSRPCRCWAKRRFSSSMPTSGATPICAASAKTVRQTASPTSCSRRHPHGKRAATSRLPDKC